MKNIIMSLPIVLNRVALISWLVSSATACFSQQKVQLTQDVDSLILQYLIEQDLPSAAVGIVYEDNILYENRVLSNQHSVENDQFSIYNIASVAKPFVATALMILVEEGKINLSAPVVNYLPNFKIGSKFTNNITIEHLLSHTSGLPNISSPDDYEYNEVDTTDDALTNHIQSLSSLKLKFKPGKKYSYSNVGYEVLGQVIAEVSNSSFDNFMKEKLFFPLQMKRTSYILSDFSQSEIAQPHAGHPMKVTDRFPYNRAFSPSGNLFTSITDINKWMIFNLNQGQYKDFKPLSSVNFDLLRAPKIPAEEGDFIGLGWFSNDNLVFHDGLDLGYSALMVLFTKQKIGITVFINHQEANCNELLNLIIKAIKF